jgi:hypothetical protein
MIMKGHEKERLGAGAGAAPLNYSFFGGISDYRSLASLVG